MDINRLININRSVAVDKLGVSPRIIVYPHPTSCVDKDHIYLSELNVPDQKLEQIIYTGILAHEYFHDYSLKHYGSPDEMFRIVLADTEDIHNNDSQTKEAISHLSELVEDLRIDNLMSQKDSYLSSCLKMADLFSVSKMPAISIIDRLTRKDYIGAYINLVCELDVYSTPIEICPNEFFSYPSLGKLIPDIKSVLDRLKRGEISTPDTVKRLANLLASVYPPPWKFDKPPQKGLERKSDSSGEGENKPKGEKDKEGNKSPDRDESKEEEEQSEGRGDGEGDSESGVNNSEIRDHSKKAIDRILKMVEKAVKSTKSGRSFKGLPIWKKWAPGDLPLSSDEMEKWGEEEAYKTPEMDRRAIKAKRPRERSIEFVIDTSGSIGQTLVKHFEYIVKGLHKIAIQQNVKKFGVMGFTGSPYTIIPFAPLDEIVDVSNVNLRSDGGTRLSTPLINVSSILENEIGSTCVVLTDGAVETPDKSLAEYLDKMKTVIVSYPYEGVTSRPLRHYKKLSPRKVRLFTVKKLWDR